MTTSTITVESEDLKVELGRDVLREAGWITQAEADEQIAEAACMEPHCDEDTCRCGDLAPGATEALVAWHNENHTGVYRLCYEQPCRDVRKAAE